MSQQGLIGLDFTVTFIPNINAPHERCATLPSCDLVLNVARKDIAPVWTHSLPISKEPVTLGDHLKMKRFQTGIRQAEAAHKLEISSRTLSLWECDRVYPCWSEQPKIIAYLGYDPFTNPALGRPLGNETIDVAFLTTKSPITFGESLIKRRLELRKTRKEFAERLGVTAKTGKNWETNQRVPVVNSLSKLKRLGVVLNLLHKVGE